MPRILVSILFVCPLILTFQPPSGAQEPSAQSPASQEPQVKVNVLNVCTPSKEEQNEISSALGRVPKEPLFGSDFEVSRGRSTLADMPVLLQTHLPGHVAGEPSIATYVRIRKEFSVQALFSHLQYSFSNDGHTMLETLVLHVRDPKDLIQVSVEDSASAVTSPEAMLGVNTPVNRIRLERFGKSSVTLARCEATALGPAPDQSAYEPLFRGASDLMAEYRLLLGVKTIVPQELAKINPAPKAGSTSKMKKSPVPQR